MASEGVLLVHYAEIGTKGRNRPFFERKLADDVRRRLAPADVLDARVVDSRVVARLSSGFSPERVHEAMPRVFGTAWYAFATAVRAEWPPIESAAFALVEERLRGLESRPSFKVLPRRSDKRFPMRSVEIGAKLGEAIAQRFGLEVDLDEPGLTVHVEVVRERAFVFLDRHQGPRGMPQGSAGRLLSLFSGGIDSPVAAWMMMRRGASIDLLHLHPFGSGEPVLKTKIAALHKRLQVFDPGCRLFLVPHDRYQIQALFDIPPIFEMILFRRFLFLCGESLALSRGMKGLVTGDSLGQVASQTLENLLAAGRRLEVPVFSPLIALDKQKIMELARELGTFELSNEPYKDCCSLVSRKPKTRVSLERLAELEARADLPALVRESLSRLELWDGRTLTRPSPKTSPEAAPPAKAV